IMTGRLGCISTMRGRRSRPLSPGSARSRRSRSNSLRERSLRPEGPSLAALTVKPSSVSRVSSDSRMAASSSMMRMRGSPTTRAVRCRWRVSAASSVVSDMHRLSLYNLGLALWRLRDGGGTCARGGELQLEGSADADFAFDMDLAGVFLHDAVADGEAEPGAFVLSFLGLGLGGEKGIVDAVEVLLLDAITGVLNADHDATCAVEGCYLERCIGGSKHCVFCVQHEVQDHLLQLALVAVDAGEVWVEVGFDSNLRGLELMLQQGDRIAEEF